MLKDQRAPNRITSSLDKLKLLNCVHCSFSYIQETVFSFCILLCNAAVWLDLMGKLPGVSGDSSLHYYGSVCL